MVAAASGVSGAAGNESYQRWLAPVHRFPPFSSFDEARFGSFAYCAQPVFRYGCSSVQALANFRYRYHATDGPAANADNTPAAAFTPAPCTRNWQTGGATY
jgi:hypothetical protein